METATQTDTVARARNQILDILKRYQLDWFDVAPDVDDALWQKMRRDSKQVRRSLFR